MIDFYHDSILKLEVDAIVNPAHPNLRAGGGLCRIIHNRAGKNLETYYRMLEEHEYDDVVITPALNLPHCKNFIHACAPYWVNYKYLCSKETKSTNESST
jgi:O-acetyl-ADP-ribose deacetylase (regulator of RNase III)